MGKNLNLKSNGRSGGTTNLYFEKGSISYKDLLKLNKKTLYITETIGHGSNLGYWRLFCGCYRIYG